MLRSGWEFKYTAKKLVEAAAKKKAFHEGRKKFWEAAKSNVMDKIRESGIDVSESEAGASYSNTNRGYGPQVVIRPELQLRLTECHQKIQEHDGKVREYAGWISVFTDNSDDQFTLHADDYLFFFGE